MRRALFCGYGWVARTLWQPALAAAGFTGFGAIDSHLPSATLREGGIDAIYERIADAGGYTVAVVGTPNVSHVPVAESCLRQGIPTVVEKPVCRYREDVDRLRTASVVGGAPMTRSRSTRYEPHVAVLMDRVHRLAAGPPDRLVLTWRRAGGLPGSPWLTTAEHAGAGSSVDLGWHLLECAFDLTGWQPMSLASATFSAAGQSIPPARTAGWHGTGGAGAYPVDVDVAADLRFTQGHTDVTVATAWIADVLTDSVSIELTWGDRGLHLDTLFGVSPDGSTAGRLWSWAGDDRKEILLPDRRPGAAHAEMVNRYAAANFAQEAVEQTWDQLDRLAAAIEPVFSSHDRWRASTRHKG